MKTKFSKLLKFLLGVGVGESRGWGKLDNCVLVFVDSRSMFVCLGNIAWFGGSGIDVYGTCSFFWGGGVIHSCLARAVEVVYYSIPLHEIQQGIYKGQIF